ncbi:hypothetical protein METBIDRAFT_190588 [Metschnikowia bicuspidata var. bicuspidata NRRL YB-4993]|uniref:Uncharacterized protein n=1 Tax=Metschnikowia bicuspidata var. bicuspidata NRRL YB-4993 TaxID=869754 RepID=A0A1A0HCE8_9ASCO|nr:hypothetical protein METBIDRAFT_190588 [Metschnikowia bicuspidata var. bicuspidata NRRL YB-4993]OBA21670.1 hypothetical protein METBIDRAFT_190588 [Metschnikowia bicuspidata var. bicuspidata NRRL YB-4993]
MKLHFYQSDNTAGKKLSYEPIDGNLSLPWLKQTRLVALDSQYVEMEAPSDPAVGIARALAFHLRDIGIFDGYDPDDGGESGGYSDFTCKLELVLIHSNKEYQIVLNLYYRYRGDKKESQKTDLSDVQISNWLFDRIVNDSNSLPLIEMKLRHLLQLDCLNCTINGLEVEL